MTKNLYIIAGCNGAGKTTASYTILPEILDCKEFVNADEEPTARRRYIAGIDNLFNLYIPEVDYWMIYDNSESPCLPVAQGKSTKTSTLYDEDKLNKIKSYVRKR